MVRQRSPRDAFCDVVRKFDSGMCATSARAVLAIAAVPEVFAVVVVDVRNLIFTEEAAGGRGGV